ncbi:glucose-6-phosphate dehydrogenase [Desulfoscipio sp. XC116]|uniref:glucose-6-phosphate dehydrogenase n=1 Tax=Desulfoscipio sp. XC116 TaxID=3144975 RepID=UPI00325AF625
MIKNSWTSDAIVNAGNTFNFSISTNPSCILVIFGGTGDLTHRKLMPALYNLQCSQKLPGQFAVVAVGRRDKSHEDYRYEVYASIKNFSRFDIREQSWDKLHRRIYYRQFNFTDPGGYIGLADFLRQLDEQYQTRGNRIFYLAVAPEYFSVIVEKLQACGLAHHGKSWQRVMIEKPFGRDLSSARRLNQKITEVFKEKDIFRIDHYLGKEMLQNIMVIRFANMFFEPVWNNQFIDNIQITSCEKVGVENRGGYYEQSGALRDMVQNHMLQLLSLTAMEPPAGLDTEAIRNEKVKVLSSLQRFTPELVHKNVIRGQYGPGIAKGETVPGYRQEKLVAPDSNTETFMALKVHVENFRWAGVPFYIRTGKRMPFKSTQIIVQFKPLPKVLYARRDEQLHPNLLVIKIQPQEGIFFQINAKKPGTQTNIVPVQMDFCQNCLNDLNSPEAYERLLFEALRGDSTLFTRWDEVEHSWQFVDNIAATWQQHLPAFPNYPAGDRGPQEADKLVARNGREWLHIGRQQ